ncbi:MAG: autotransporter-associated beta strand repeat-containing protein [Akkermansiaceae bacterium]
MKSKFFNLLLVSSVALSFSNIAQAQVIKANNTADLFSGDSWTGSVAPGSTGIATWDNTVTAANSSTLGTTATWLGIKIADPTGNVSINVATGRALSMGASGIDLSTATSDLTVGGNGLLRPTGSSTSDYNVASGRILTLNSTFQATSGTTTVRFNGAGTVNINKLGGTPASATSLILSNTGSGTVNYGGSAISGVFQINATGAGSSVVVNGPSLTVSQGSFIGSGSAAAGKLELQSGSLNYNAGVTLGNTDGNLLKVSGGTFTATNVSIGRTSNPGQTTNASLTSGFVVTGGTATLSGNLTVGTFNSSATSRVDGGAVTIGGTAIVGNTTNTRWNTLQVSSGTLDVNGADGVQLSTNTAFANLSQVRLTGGTTTIEAIRYGVATSFAGSRGDVIVNNGAALYVGSGGVSVVSGNTYTSNFSLTGATLGAKANWSTSVPIALSGNATIKAADVTDTSFNINLNGQLSGSGANLIKTGGGTLTLGTSNSYSGATTISAGSLALDGSGSIASSPTIINNGNFNVSAVTGGFSLASTQTLSGSGTVTGAMTVAGTLSPGNSPGTLTTGDQTWSNGGDYNWQVLDATGSAGTGFDTIAVTGTLDLSSLTAGQFGINLWSLSAIGPDVSGNAGNFNNLLTQSWIILTTTGGITGFDAADFLINVGANNGTGGFSNVLDAGGAFSLGSTGSNLVLTYAVIPEPSAALLGGFGLLALLRRRRRD